jgi:sugar phosphate permease
LKDRQIVHWAWIILATCFVNLFINYSVRLGYGVILPEMIPDLNLTRAAGGTIFNVYLFTYLALTPLTGHLTDRFGARPVVSGCALILGFGAILMGTVQSPLAASLFFGVCGLGATGLWTPIITVVQRWYALRRRGMALGILSTGYGLGFATMGLVFPWVVRDFTWRYAWYVLGMCALTMAAINGLVLRSSPEAMGLLPWGEKGPAMPGGSDRTGAIRPRIVSVVLKDKNFWLIGFAYLSVSYGLYAVTTFMVDFGKHQMGLSIEKASFLATIHGVCQVVGVLTILPLSDHLGRKRTIMLSNAFITASLMGIIFSPGDSVLALYVFVGVMAVFYGVTFPIHGACAGDYFPRELMGTVIGFWTPFYGSGAILAHWVTGTLRDMTGQYHQGFGVGAAMAGMGLLLMSFVTTGRPGETVHERPLSPDRSRHQDI